jgi:2-polyprenyl-6-hydroxyphenyl methylase/3-demethylubiquinone-9 3-methyltransferase
MRDSSMHPDQLGPAMALTGEASGTIDADQVAHFNAQVFAGPEAENARRWLHRYNPVRVAFVETLAGVARRGARILDIGCGTGIFCEALAATGAAVTGIDPAQEAVAFATRQAQQQGLPISYRHGPVERLGERFSVVTAMEVIEHVPDYAAFLRACANRVEPGGIFVLSTINRTLKSYIYAILAGEYVLRLLPRGAHQWRRFVRPCEVEAVLRELGFRTLAVSGVTMNLRTRALQQSDDFSVNYLLAAQRQA